MFFMQRFQDWFMQSTDKESEYRRKENKRVNTFVFLTDTAIKFILPLAGVLVSAFIIEDTIVRSVIGGVSLLSIAFNFRK